MQPPVQQTQVGNHLDLCKHPGYFHHVSAQRQQSQLIVTSDKRAFRGGIAQICGYLSFTNVCEGAKFNFRQKLEMSSEISEETSFKPQATGSDVCQQTSHFTETAI